MSTVCTHCTRRDTIRTLPLESTKSERARIVDSFNIMGVFLFCPFASIDCSVYRVLQPVGSCVVSISQLALVMGSPTRFRESVLLNSLF